ncbi:hypothetical protein Acsp05_15010 [Actinokineospora sp. NBRC 105648]|nr:hypothetical protein Acsp05_15010 [Actinokineospora sp. NBRC 105648]
MRDKRGSTTVELVVIMPFLLMIVLSIAQFAVWSHANHIAQAAAAEALSAARVQGGTAHAGQTEADQVLDHLGRGPLHDIQVEVRRGANGVSVAVTGTASPVVPFLHLSVRAEAAGPVEVFRPAASGGGP